MFHMSIMHVASFALVPNKLPVSTEGVALPVLVSLRGHCLLLLCIYCRITCNQNRSDQGALWFNKSTFFLEDIEYELYDYFNFLISKINMYFIKM